MSNGKKRTVGSRIYTIIILSLVLMLPTLLVAGLVYDRETTRNTAVREVSDKWGGSQTITGPILTIPFRHGSHGPIQYAHFLPDELTVKGGMIPELRSRGIYQIVLYGTKLSMSGKFPAVSFKNFNVPKENILWKDAFVSVGISDIKGIKDQVSIKWDGNVYSATSTLATNDVFSSGISAKAPVNENRDAYTFNLEVNLNGSRELNITPVGKQTNAALSSSWNSPSFQGFFLPGSREITKNGFSAEWRVLQQQKLYSQQWIGRNPNITRSSFGVTLVTPVDGYQMTMRTLKYSLIFIVLTFVAFFTIELFGSKPIHMIQYLLVGLALIIFYVLLLSLSEHMAFKYSYLVAATCTVTLITLYSKTMVSRIKFSALIFLLLGALYAYLYLLLQTEDFTLLIGSFTLFGMLALFMFLTRKTDWFSALQSTGPVVTDKLER
jgi:inner membrane protein